jgi:hypothetical protein
VINSFDGLGPSGFHPWRRFFKDQAWTPLRAGIFCKADPVRRVGGAPF